MKRILTFLTIAALAAAGLLAQDSGSSTLNLTVGPEAAFSAAFVATTLTAANTKFGGYSGTTNFSYKIRTTESTGSGTITVQNTDFAAGGPTINSDLTFTCTDTASGTPCAGSAAASDTAAVTVVSFGAGVHSADAGDSGSVGWILADRPAYKTGSYSSTATFTISAL